MFLIDTVYLERILQRLLKPTASIKLPSSPCTLQTDTYLLRVRSNSPPSVRREHAVAPSGNFPVRNLLQQRELVATTAAAAVALAAD